MSSQYFQRNTGLPLLIKLGILVVAGYLIILLLKVFAVVLAAVFVFFKYLLLIALFGLLGSLVLKLLFGVNVLSFKDRSNVRYYKKY
jgi:hypothetical protein